MISNLHLQAGTLSTAQLNMANVNHDDANVWTLLMRAIQEKNLEIVKFLLDCGVDVEKTTKDGKTFRVLLLS